MSRFGRVSDNTCCRGNVLNIFWKKKGTLIKPILPQLHFFIKFAEHVYHCENMSVKIIVLILKNIMAAVANLPENY